MKDFMKKPVTWGGYFKLCGVSMIISVIYTIVYWFWWKNTLDW